MSSQQTFFGYSRFYNSRELDRQTKHNSSPTIDGLISKAQKDKEFWASTTTGVQKDKVRSICHFEPAKNK